MTHIITSKSPNREEWIIQLANVIKDPMELLNKLGLSTHQELLDGLLAQKLFSFRVPEAFVDKMEYGNPFDPLFRQVITSNQEFIISPDFTTDPLNEQDNKISGLLHKYQNRALMMIKTGCAINCRYCFRRHFPYAENQGNKKNWLQAIDYLKQQEEIEEVIFSGGDPLMAKDLELAWLISHIESIPHIKRLRIHSRLASVLPARITKNLCDLFNQSRLKILLVTHINHPNEIGEDVKQAMALLKKHDVTLLNQSVLLKRINDNAQTLALLSNALFDAGIMPYYLHVLDKVEGACHFYISDEQAKQLVKALTEKVSGYLVPKLVREIGGEKSKTPLNLDMYPS